MIDSILLIDDEDLFHLVFEDACSLLDVALNVQSVNSMEEADIMFKKWGAGEKHQKPECVFVDMYMVNSPFSGVEMVRRINEDYGNGYVIGIISSKSKEEDLAKAKEVGAQFWMIKNDAIEPRLEEFKRDYELFKNKTAAFKVYR